MKSERVQRTNVLLGIMRVARGRADGIDCFGGTPQSFLSSLAPLLAFPLVGTGITIFTDGPRAALTGLAMTVCVILMPVVLSFEFARYWGRAGNWARFATAFNWCEWTLPALACVLVIPLSVMVAAGMDEHFAGILLVACLGMYGLWLNWFLVRRGLGLSRWRALAMIVFVNLGTIITVTGPTLLSAHVG